MDCHQISLASQSMKTEIQVMVWEQRVRLHLLLVQGALDLVAAVEAEGPPQDRDPVVRQAVQAPREVIHPLAPLSESEDLTNAFDVVYLLDFCNDLCCYWL